MSATTPKRAFLGDILIQKGYITPEEKEKALQVQREGGRRLGEVLVEMGLVAEDDISRVLAEQSGLPFFRLRKGLVDPRVVELFPKEKAESYEVLPLFRVHNKLTVAISDPNKSFVVDALQKQTRCGVQLVVSPRADILRMIEENYDKGDVLIEDFLANMDGEDIELITNETDERIEDITQMAGESPIITLVNQIVLKALRERASDIHIEPERGFFRVRFRIDGVLYPIMQQRIELHAPVISRIKLMANADIAERRLPQDGRIQVMADGRTVDLRFSSLPGVFGEKVVLRVLDRQRGVLDLDQLGFGADTMSALRRLLRRPNGLLLVTGPTGSGKTTTLYSALSELNSLERNIVTIEDPVEYQFDIISQTQVKEEIGLTFARILRHTLRQDPDVLMVGEIRDPETAKIAVQAALTGHLVLSTMHTNDAASSIARLLEIGIESYLLAPSLLGVIAQRLVRTICPECAMAYYAPAVELEALNRPGEEKLQLRKGKGCSACFDSGYMGRTGLYEMLTTSNDLQKLLIDSPSLEGIRRYQAEQKLPTLKSEADKLVLEGKTTLDEVARAVFVE
jgi:type IV pilus assembly protein PilB